MDAGQNKNATCFKDRAGEVRQVSLCICSHALSCSQAMGHHLGLATTALGHGGGCSGLELVGFPSQVKAWLGFNGGNSAESLEVAHGGVDGRPGFECPALSGLVGPKGMQVTSQRRHGKK